MFEVSSFPWEAGISSIIGPEDGAIFSCAGHSEANFTALNKPPLKSDIVAISVT